MPWLDDSGLTQLWGGLKTRFARIGHKHAQSDVEGLAGELAGKAAASHSHVQAQVTGLADTLAEKVSASNPHISSVLVDDRIKTSSQQLVNVNPDGNWIFVGNPATRLLLESNSPVYANVAGDEKPLYRKGDGGIAQNEVTNLQSDLAQRWTLSGGKGIPENADLNNLTYWQAGNYVISATSTAETIKNIPEPEAGFLKVYGSLGQDSLGGTWRYMTQQYETLNKKVYTRTAHANGSGAISYTEWSRTYRTGDLVAVRSGVRRSISVPTTGWTYQASTDRYAREITVSGVEDGMDAHILSANLGGKFPLLGLYPGAGKVTIYMADMPTLASTIYVDFFKFT